MNHTAFLLISAILFFASNLNAQDGKEADAAASSADSGEVDIYIVAGQSNGWRLSSLAAVEGKGGPKVYYFGMGCSTRPDKATLTTLDALHPGLSGAGLGEALLEHSKRDIVFIQYCVCGSSIGDVVNWYPGDDPQNGVVNDTGIYGHFTLYLADARQQLQAIGIPWKVKGLFWHQGESDVKRDSAVHEKNLKNLIFRFRKDLGKNLPIVAGHIRDLDEGSRGINRALDRLAERDDLMVVVPLVDLPYESATDVHIKPAGCILYGRQMVAAFSALTAAR